MKVKGTVQKHDHLVDDVLHSQFAQAKLLQVCGQVFPRVPLPMPAIVSLLCAWDEVCIVVEHLGDPCVLIVGDGGGV